MKFKNQEYYKKVKVSPNLLAKPLLNRSNWLIFLLSAVICMAVAPYLALGKGYVMPSTFSEYEHLMSMLIPAALCMMLVLLWVIQFKPYLEMKNGYWYVGKFEISNKKQILGLYYVQLLPGKRNWVKVSEKMYRSFKIGETIELTRATFGGINEIKKISSLRQRIRKHDYAHRS